MTNTPDETSIRYVLHYINDGLTSHTDVVRIKIPSKLEESLYKLEASSTTTPQKPNAAPLLDVLHWLRAFDFIETTALKTSFNDKGSLIIEGPMDIQVKNIDALNELRQQLDDGQLEAALANLPAIISYNDEKKVGYAVINGRDVELITQNKLLFELLYSNNKRWQQIEDVLKLVLGEKKDFDSSDAKLKFNDLVQNLRKKTGLSTKQLENRMGTVRIWAVKR